MKTFSDISTNTPALSHIMLTDETTGEQVSFNEIELLQLQALVMQDHISYTRFYQILTDTNNKEHKEYYILDGGEVNPQLELVSNMDAMRDKINRYKSILLDHKIKMSNEKF